MRKFINYSLGEVHPTKKCPLCKKDLIYAVWVFENEDLPVWLCEDTTGCYYEIPVKENKNGSAKKTK